MRALVAATALAGLLATAWVAFAGGPSTVIYPVQRLPISFSHGQHLALKIGCGYCHDAARSRRAADLDLPGEDTCATCHAIDRAQPGKQVAPGEPDARCDACHPGWNGAGSPPRLVVPTPNLKFNHQVHAALGVRCTVCHGDLAAEGVNLATRAQLPRMALCLGCHDGRKAPDACTTCHVGERDGRVRTDFPEGRLVPSGTLRGDAHDLEFRTRHARVAANDEGYCASCHTREACTDCHDGVSKPLDFHGNDYVSLHAIDARRQTLDCGSCHRLATFCTGCHARTGVSDDPRTSELQRPSRATADLPALNRFHPEGWWTGNQPGMRGASHHSFQAQRNLRACASCHREDFCRDCHAQEINPHPAGFGGSARCRALAARAGRTCLRCHTDASAVHCD